MSGTEVTVAALAGRVWDAVLAEDPLNATALGFHEYDALLPDNGLAAADTAERRLRELREETEAVPVEQLSREDRVTRSALLAFLEPSWRATPPSTPTGTSIPWRVPSWCWPAPVSGSRWPTRRSGRIGRAAGGRWHRTWTGTARVCVARLRPAGSRPRCSSDR